MSIDSEMEEQEQELCDLYNNSDITLGEYNKEIDQLQIEYRAMKEEACEDAYSKEAENWN